MKYPNASTEPLYIIRANECEAPSDLATRRFQALWNEIERQREALRQVIIDCEEAGNLSYAARTAREGLGADHGDAP